MGGIIRRKVIQIGNSTQLVSVPRKWAIEHGLKKGDEVWIETNGPSLTIRIEKKALQKKELSVDVSELDRTSLMEFIRALYRKGYSTINLSFKNQMTPHFRKDRQVKTLSAIHSEVYRLTGMEIVKQKEGYCEIQCLSEVSSGQFEGLVRRVFLLLNDAWKDFSLAVMKNDLELLDTIEEKHDTITKFISYCLRALNLQGHKETENVTFLYHVLAVLDKVTDLLKYAARDLLKYASDVAEPTKDILKQIDKAFDLYYKFYYSFDLANYSKITQQRSLVRENMGTVIGKIPGLELKVLGYVDHAIELLFDLSSARTSMEY